MAVEDSEGRLAYLKLFNYVTLIDATQEERESVLPIGTALLIREPSYASNFSVPKLPFIRVDTPSDLLFLDGDHPILREVTWKSKLTIPVQPSTGEAWRAAALKSFKAKGWFYCAIAFSNCIKLGHDVQTSRLNRSEAYLRLGWNNSAFHDSKDALDSGTLTEDLKKKAVVRMIKAQYARQQYDSILELVKLLPEGDLSALEWATKATRRIEEQTTGNFDWNAIFRGAQSPHYSPDVADFTGPVEVKVGSNGMRGTFVTRDVKAGELLVRSKTLLQYIVTAN